MDEQFERRRTAVAVLVRSVLDHLVALEGQPRIGRVIDVRRWWRYGQEDFVGLQPRAWSMPADVPIVGWLDKFPEMTAVRQAYDADPVLGARVDTLIGTEFNRQGRNFDWLLIEHIVQLMVLATSTYRFDEAIFDQLYDRFERGLGAEQVNMVEFLPLNGFESTETVVLLPDGLVMQRMNDAQMSAAIDHLAVPRMSGGSVNGARVSRFDQWALTVERSYPVTDGRSIAVSQPPAFPTLYEPANTLIRALRIVCGGSVVATRSMFAQADDEFPIVLGVSAMLSAFDGADNDRPTYLLTNTLDTFRLTYTALNLPSVQADRSLQTAIRRLVFAGSRRVNADRLIDLMMSAEALFIKRANLPRGTKGDKIAAAAAALLAQDPELKAGADQIQTFMKTMYQVRNAEMHGDDQPHPHLHLLDGTPTDSMPSVLKDGEKIMRRAALTVLAEYTAP
ncbi:hypothetical protein ABZU75_44410 [Streptosporangium sp. NPDC005286]|uniref:hypothetical protein n=1 Tax=Streptosporangium sp. NPDC005286 TaxID=3154463 RepID=UPI0033BBD670